MHSMQEYIELIEECAQQCREMLAIEGEKRRALMLNDAAAVEAAMNSQQAALMRLEALEKRRLQLQQELGLDPQATAAQILQSMAPSDERARLQSAAEQLRRSAQELQEQNRESMELARLDIRLMESLRARAGTAQTSSAGLYSRGRGPASPAAGSAKFNGSY